MNNQSEEETLSPDEEIIKKKNAELHELRLTLMASDAAWKHIAKERDKYRAALEEANDAECGCSFAGAERGYRLLDCEAHAIISKALS